MALDLSKTKGQFRVTWFDPRHGGSLLDGDVTNVTAGRTVSLGQPPKESGEDWLVVVRQAW